MAGSLKRLVSRIPGGQRGFTLIEMIVVVGIIAVLAAVIVPNIGKFIGSGEAGAKDAELESVQTAMNAMMADKAVTALTANTGGTATGLSDWTASPAPDTGGTVVLYGASADLQYLQNPTTVYYYCWDTQGRITNNPGFEAASTACP